MKSKWNDFSSRMRCEYYSLDFCESRTVMSSIYTRFSDLHRYMRRWERNRKLNLYDNKMSPPPPVIEPSHCCEHSDTAKYVPRFTLYLQESTMA